MIEESGEILAVEPPYATVVTQRRSSCGGCSTQGCGTGALSQVFAARSQEMRVLNPIDAQVGEQVVLGLEEGTLLRSSLAVYMVPLVTLIAGGLFGQWMAPALGLQESADLLAIPGALAGALSGFLWVKRFSRRIARDERYMAVVLRRASLEPLHATPVTWRNR